MPGRYHFAPLGKILTITNRIIPKGNYTHFPIQRPDQRHLISRTNPNRLPLTPRENAPGWFIRRLKMSEDRLGIETLHPFEIKSVLAFSKGFVILTEQALSNASGLDEAQLRRAVELLKTRGFLEVAEEKTTPFVELTEFGKEIIESGPIESRILEAIPDSGVTQAELKSAGSLNPEEIGPAAGLLKKLQLVDIHEGGLLTLTEAGKTGAAALRKALELFGRGPGPMALLDSIGRAFVEEKSRKRGKGNAIFSVKNKVERSFGLTEAGKAAQSALMMKGDAGDEITALTSDMLRTGSWKGRQFRKFNLKIAPPRVNVGRKHPYRVFLDMLRRKLTSLGFREMKGSLTQPEFWNCDALYMPQFHSARDIHDVYLVREPKMCPPAAEPFLSQVAATHSNGWKTGSRGWGYEFDAEQSRRNIFRSHGTVLSARTLASKPEIPGKYFAVARCFRPDKVDATHAPDFFQVEGIVLGEDINFRTLLGLLGLFAKEIAKAKEVKYAPAYFPFTEPSVEVHMKHPVLGWTELGGAGIFRPEVTAPLGVNVPVIAWGLGIDRMAMMALGINDIRELFTRDLNVLRRSRTPVL